MKKIKKDDYDLYNGKLYIYEGLDEKKIKKIGEGTEGKVYVLDNKHLIKIYKPELIRDREDLYNEFRIEEIAEKRSRIKNTHLVYGPVFINGEFSGALTHYHKFAPSIDILDVIPFNDYKINRFLEINENLHELEENGIYYIDLNSKNILLPGLKKVRLIDTDGKSTRIDETSEIYKRKMYGNLFSLILLKLLHIDMEEYSQYEEINTDKNGIEEALKDLRLDDNIKRRLCEEQFDYELIRNFLLNLRDTKILKLQMAQ